MKTLLRGALLSALVGLCLSGCDSDSSSAKQHIEQAQSYVQSGELSAALIELKNAAELSPNDASIRLALADLHWKLNKPAAALSQLRHAKRLGHKTPESDLFTMRAAIASGEVEQARRVLDEASDPGQSVDWRLAHADLLLLEQNLIGAKQQLEAVLRAAPRDPRPISRLAQIALRSNKTAQAIELLEGATADTAKDDIDSWTILGELYHRQQKFDAAIEAFSRAASLSQADNNRIQLGLVRALSAARQFDRAEQPLRELLAKFPKSAELLLLRALQEQNQDDAETAFNTLKSALEIDPKHRGSLYAGAALALRQKKAAQALQWARQFRALSGRTLNGDTLLASALLATDNAEEATQLLSDLAVAHPDDAKVAALLGQAHLRSGDAQGASEQLGRSSSLGLESDALKTQLALSQLYIGETAAAIAQLRELSQSGSDDVSSASDDLRPKLLLVVAHVSEQRFDEALRLATELVQQFPQRPVVHNLLGATYELNNNAQLARASYETALQLDKTSIATHFNFARLALREDRRADARRWLTEAIDQHPNHEMALLSLANLERLEGNLHAARELLQRARVADEQALAPRLLLGIDALANDQPEVALSLVREARAIAPQNPDVRLAFARALMANSEIRRATDVYESLLSAESTPPSLPPRLARRVRLELSDIYAQRGEYARTLKLLETLATGEPADVPALSRYVRAVIATGQPERAESYLQTIEQAAPDSSMYWDLVGAKHAASGARSDAIEAWRTSFERDPNSATVQRLASALFADAQPEEATALLTQWVETHPNDVPVQLALADFRLRQSQFNDAVVLYESVLTQQPKHGLALNNLAWLYDNSGDPRAVSIAERAHEISPDEPAVQDTLGWLLVRNGELNRGRTLLDKAARGSPKNGDIRYHRAVAMERNGERLAAVTELRDLLAQIPRFSKRKEAERLLSILQ